MLENVTMVLGLDTPSTFGNAFLVLLPVLNEGYFHQYVANAPADE